LKTCGFCSVHGIKRKAHTGMVFVVDFGLVLLLIETKEQCNRDFNRNEMSGYIV
jgi:hypothetical protein